MCRVQKTAESVESITCEWQVYADNVVRIVLPQSRPAHVAATEIFVRGGEVSLTDASLNETVELSLTADGAAVSRFTFVPEEHVNEG